MKALQIHSAESLERGKNMSAEEILRFLEEFRLMYAAQAYQSREETLFEPLDRTNSQDPAPDNT